MRRRTFLQRSASIIGFGALGVITVGVKSPGDFDVIIRGGTLIDGSGAEGSRGDIAILDDVIVAIGDLSGYSARRSIDAEGRVVCPGFIDIHSHSEDELLVSSSGDSKLRQGVTTEILGQDGNSIAPLTDDMQKSLNDLYQYNYGITVDWWDLAGYFNRLATQGVALNVGSMVGQGTIRENIIGESDRTASFAEIRAMKRLTLAALRQGALGVSSGLEYTPGAFASSEELHEICRTMHFSTGIYATHMRDEADFVLEALDEAIAIARGADVALHISHLKCIGPRNWSKLRTIFERINDARRKGLSISFDRYPYVAYNTNLSSLFPLWCRSGDTESFLERLRDPALLPRIRQETLSKVEMIGSWEAILITAVESQMNQRYQGQRVTEAIAGNGTDPFDFIRQLVISESNGVDISGFAMSEANTEQILSHPLCMIASDASARSVDGPLNHLNPHPRTYGTFPRVLGHYVRERKSMTLPEAIRKMTHLPAIRLGLRHRGLLREGYFADIVVFDPETIADKATFTEPHQYPVGISHVLVNGQIAVENDTQTDALAGAIIRREPGNKNIDF